MSEIGWARCTAPQCPLATIAVAGSRGALGWRGCGALCGLSSSLEEYESSSKVDSSEACFEADCSSLDLEGEGEEGSLASSSMAAWVSNSRAYMNLGMMGSM